MKNIIIYFIVYSILIGFAAGCTMAGHSRKTSKELQRAENALLEAQQRKADIYAPRLYEKALSTLKKARENVAVQEYKKAADIAQQATQLAIKASSKSIDEKSRYRTMAEGLLYETEKMHKNLLSSYPDSSVKFDSITVHLTAGRRLYDAGKYKQSVSQLTTAHNRLLEAVQKMKSKGTATHESEADNFAEEIVEAAKEKAREIIEDARKEAVRIRQTAREQALQERKKEFERMFPSTYTVKKGETLMDIAARKEIFNDRLMWPLIYKANRDQIRDPMVIFPGQKLTIPRDITFEEIIEARKEADADPPYIPPENAYNPELYHAYMGTVPDADAPAADQNGPDTPSGGEQQ